MFGNKSKLCFGQDMFGNHDMHALQCWTLAFIGLLESHKIGYEIHRTQPQETKLRQRAQGEASNSLECISIKREDTYTSDSNHAFKCLSNVLVICRTLYKVDSQTDLGTPLLRKLPPHPIFLESSSALLCRLLQNPIFFKQHLVQGVTMQKGGWCANTYFNLLLDL